MLNQDFAVAALDDGGEFFSPFDQEDGVFGRQFIEADGLQLAFVFNAVEIDVVQLYVAVLAVDR